ncbi:MAG: hypothetical protein ACI8RD_013548, partial [Bacillariaceae sp.]
NPSFFSTKIYTRLDRIMNPRTTPTVIISDQCFLKLVEGLLAKPAQTHNGVCCYWKQDGCYS